MDVHHRRIDVLMPQQLLDCPDVVPGLDQMRREGMPDGMTRRRLSMPITRIADSGRNTAASGDACILAALE